jgi:hypothetical protein
MRKLLAAAGIVLAAAFAFASPALAVTTTTDYVNDYGTGAGKVIPKYGSVGQMSSDYVTVKDSADNIGNRFYDQIAFDNSGTIDSLSLTLTISGGLDNVTWGIFPEDWRVYGSTNGGTSVTDRLQLGSALTNGGNWVVTLLATAGSAIFDQAVNSGLFAFWFGDEAFGSNSFKLYDATLSVTSTTAAVPLPAGLPLLAGGLALLGMLGARRARRTVA